MPDTSDTSDQQGRSTTLEALPDRAPDFMSLTELGRRLDVSRSTVHDWHAAGRIRIPVHRFSAKVIRVAVADYEAALAAGESIIGPA